ncbi:hypothetical protein PPERSA_06346 [Pseudocohnilembus persalinus]|uniref:Uncharacterized protein n=1 Tax=Pseudocohnilembus persalinus TaxID=266149 RepID=A0A0V0QIZ2_PSEPJ|nr:hypothetical protein PPERSA_06346 [Pseudocohnilembus persalinus]|eukprot:KRX02151.1 hypothetical protein PPERSA_06346 [Pseudocohnilembus persalinus]
MQFLTALLSSQKNQNRNLYSYLFHWDHQKYLKLRILLFLKVQPYRNVRRINCVPNFFQLNNVQVLPQINFCIFRLLKILLKDLVQSQLLQVPGLLYTLKCISIHPLTIPISQTSPLPNDKSDLTVIQPFLLHITKKIKNQGIFQLLINNNFVLIKKIISTNAFF